MFQGILLCNTASLLLTLNNDGSVVDHLAARVLGDARVVGRVLGLQVRDGQVELIRSRRHHLDAVRLLQQVQSARQ